MIKKFLLSFVCVTLFSCSLVAHPLRDIDPLVENVLKTFEVPGIAVGVVMGDKVLLAKGYGKCALNRQQEVTSQTLFAIGSCTKAFTAFALGQLVEEGIVSWDDKVITHLPEFRLKDEYATQHMTIRDLLSHRSGMPRHDFMWYNADLSREGLLHRLVYLEPSYDLREKFQYNNLMYLVAGLVIERVTGLSWEEVVSSRIFNPLGMVSANFSVEKSQGSRDFSSPHGTDQGEVCVIPFRNISTMGPAGSINASIDDLLPWLKLHLGETSDLIGDMSLKEMHSSQTPLFSYPIDGDYNIGYGIGWFLGIHQGHYVVQHGGGIDGFISNITLLPEKKIGIVILTNNSQTGGVAASVIVTSVVDRLLGNEKVDRIHEMSTQLEQAQEGQKMLDQEREKNRILNTAPSLPLSSFVGKYFHQAYGTVEIGLENDQLYALFHEIKLSLEHWQENVFSGTNEGILSKFTLDFSFKVKSHQVVDVKIPFEPSVEPIHFMRVRH